MLWSMKWTLAVAWQMSWISGHFGGQVKVGTENYMQPIQRKGRRWVTSVVRSRHNLEEPATVLIVSSVRLQDYYDSKVYLAAYTYLWNVTTMAEI